MFSINGLLQGTIKRLLNKYIKPEAATPQSSASASASLLHIKHLHFREDVLDEHASRFGMKVVSAELAELKADVSFSGSSNEIQWNGITIDLKPLIIEETAAEQVKQANQADEMSAAETALGSSLFGGEAASASASASLPRNSSESSLLSSFSNPIRGIQNKIESFVTSIVHVFNDLKITWSEDDDMHFTLHAAGQYSDDDGVFIERLVVIRDGYGTILSLSECSVSIGNDKTLNVECESVVAKISESVLCTAVMRLQQIREVQQRQGKTEAGPSFHLNKVKLHEAKLISNWMPYEEVIASDVHINIRKGRAYAAQVKLGFGNVLSSITVRWINNSYPINSGRATVGSSPFDEDKIFLFHSKPKPAPLADSKQMSSFIHQQRQTAQGSISVHIETVNITEMPVDLQRSIETFQALIEELVPVRAVTSSSAAISPGYAVELSVTTGTISIDELNDFEIVLNQGSAIVTPNFTFWSGQIKGCELRTKAAEVLSLEHIRIAGRSLSRISCDVSKICLSEQMTPMELADNIVVWCEQLLEEDAEPVQMDFLVRAKTVTVGRMGHVLPERCEISQLEVFNSGPHHVVISCSSIAIPNWLKLTSCQVRLGEAARISIASVYAQLTPTHTRKLIDQIMQWVSAQTATPVPPTAFTLDETSVIHNYMSTLSTLSASTDKKEHDKAADIAADSWVKFSISKAHVNISLDDDGISNADHMELLVDQFKLRAGTELQFRIERLECLDRISASNWNKAIIAQYLAIRIEQPDNYHIVVGSGLDRRGAAAEVVLSLDQHTIDFFGQFIAGLATPTSLRLEEEDNTQADSVQVNSFQVSGFRARVDYKPCALFSGGVPLRDARVKVKRFQLFDSNWKQIGIAFGLHTLNEAFSGMNLPRVISGIKPLRTPASIFRNIAELVVIVPSSAATTTSFTIEPVIRQAKSVATQTAISVLELGPALNVRRIGDELSIHAQQPASVKEGFVQAGQTFSQDMGTAIAFITGDMHNVDLLEVPLVVIRPFTAPLADIINGMCNQLDPERYDRMRNKYG